MLRQLDVKGLNIVLEVYKYDFLKKSDKEEAMNKVRGGRFCCLSEFRLTGRGSSELITTKVSSHKVRI